MTLERNYNNRCHLCGFYLIEACNSLFLSMICLENYILLRGITVKNDSHITSAVSMFNSTIKLNKNIEKKDFKQKRK